MVNKVVKPYRAKREYVCSVCEKPILKGDEYYPCGKKPYLYKYHPKCKPQTFGRPLRLFGGAEHLLKAVENQPTFMDELEDVGTSHFYKLKKLDVPISRLRYNLGGTKSKSKRSCQFTIYYLEGSELDVIGRVVERFGFFPVSLKTGLGLSSTFVIDTTKYINYKLHRV